MTKWVSMLLPALLSAASTWGVIQYRIGSLDQSLAEIKGSLGALTVASTQYNERIENIRRDIERIERQGLLNDSDLRAINYALARKGIRVDN